MIDNLVGQTLNGYRILERLGQGASAVVYKADQIALNRVVTLKVIETSNREGHERLVRESQVLAQYKHPGIRQVFSIESSGPYAFAVLEFAEGSLRGLIEARRRENRTFSCSETARILWPVADVLDYLHQHGWLHMDIKPENILLADEDRALLADFGVAQPFGAPLSRGTPAYVAPEIIEGGAVGAAADIYSLGVVAYEMLAGRPPFSGDTPLALWHQHSHVAPPPLDRVHRRCSNSAAWVVAHALDKTPQARYVTARAFVDTLERADTISVRLPTLPRRRPGWMAVGAASLACVAFLSLRSFPPLAPPATPQAASTPGPSVSVPSTAGGIEPSPVVARPSPRPSPIVTAQPGGALPVGTATLAAQPTTPPTTPPTLTPVYVPPTATGSSIACQNADFVPGAVINEPAANAVLRRGPVALKGTADLQGGTGYEFLYRADWDSADDFHFVMERVGGRVKDGELGVWDTSKLPGGNYILRLRVKLRDGNYKDCDAPVRLE
jgi:eukaryotic-like serine/threonine-protein kinase